MQLKIDPEFRDKIPPLTPEEYKQLEENILEDGEIYEPIAVWNGTIVDGHNRWKIYLDHPELPEPKIMEKDFPDKWAAFAWMYEKQLGRRNLKPYQISEIRGRCYEAQKMSVGGTGANQYTKEQRDPMDPIASVKGINRTATELGKKFGVSGVTIKKDAFFTRGLDAGEEVSPGFHDKVISGEIKASMADVRDLRNMDVDERKEAIAAIESGEKYDKTKRKSTNPDGYNKEARNLNAEIQAIAADMYNPDTTPDFTLADLLEEIRDNGEMYIKQLKRTLDIRKDLYAGDTAAQDKVTDVITDVIIANINAIEEGIINA